jgi:V8-like Glu-specific endopeptidase
MKRNLTGGAAYVLIAAVVLGGQAHTQQLISGKVIYGTDDRIDVYEESSPQRLQWAAATCGLVSASELDYDPETDTYQVLTSSFTVFGRQPCDGEPFANQPTAPNCSGFAAGADIIATAGHCVNANSLAAVRFVFGFQMLDADNAVTTLRGDQVYEGAEVLGWRNDGSFDYAIVRLNRAITAPEVIPMPIRREGTIAEGTNVGVIGHPTGLPLKIAFGPTTTVRSSGPDGYFVANLDTYGGNSGSPVFNAITGVVEGVLVRGARDYNVVGTCFESNRIADTASGEDVSKSTSFAEFIPEITVEGPHTADIDSNGIISLSEVLRVIQLFNAGEYHCDAVKSEDGYLPGAGDATCGPHNSDFVEPFFDIELSELLRLIQFYASGGYTSCPEGEDGFCPLQR